MCHANFTTKFIPEINFIGGENGTGKSAVLTALAFGLGARAEVTGRGNNVKEFIGPHDDRTIVTVHIVQPKSDPFKTKLPGGVLSDTFLVERTVTKAGLSTIKILDTQRKTLSTKKEHLDDIKRHLNLQVDNPAVLMTQKTSKEFLTRGEPKEFYSLFMKATQVDIVEEKLKDALLSKDSIDATLQGQQEAFETFMVKDFEPASQAWQEMAEVSDLQAKHSVLARELVVWNVQEQEHEIQAAQKVLPACLVVSYLASG
jgi:chromosome segregation ATPase